MTARPLPFLLLIACTRAPADPGFAPPGDDVDSDVAAVEESDLPPLDTAVDTYAWADSADTSVEEVDPGVTLATPERVHAGLYVPGQILELEDLVVTAVRGQDRPPATNGFAVQLAGGTAPGSGLYVDVKDATLLPHVGDVVRLVGRYETWPAHASDDDETMDRIVVHTSVPGSRWTRTGSSLLPDPVFLSVADVADPLIADGYEGMLVRVAEADRLAVVATPDARTGRMDVRLSDGRTVAVTPWFFDYTTWPELGVGSSGTSLVGVLWYEPSTHAVLPRSADDFVLWQEL